MPILPPITTILIVCMILVLAGSAVQVAVGAGLSVICGPFLLLWLGPAVGLPILLSLNLLISVVATACDARNVRWGDAGLIAVATLAGCAFASMIPALSDAVMKLLTACVLVIVALPRPPAPDRPPGAASAKTGVALAGLLSGALTVWTATPGPITPVALARAGRSGADIRRTMQPISLVGYGAALAWVGPPPASAIAEGPFLVLVMATVIGIGIGFVARPWIGEKRVVHAIRIVAAAAAALLIVSVAHGWASG